MTATKTPPPNAAARRVSAFVADDEPIARAGLRDMLLAHDWIECIGEAANGPAALEAIERLRPELLFLDVQMPGLLGTELLRRASHRPYVVFTTAFPQHAVTAFELGAVDYLLKPFGQSRLAVTLARVRAALGETSPPTLHRLAETMAQGPLKRLFVRSGSAIRPVSIEDVTRFEASGDYVIAHVGRARHVLTISLRRLESRLDPGKFARVHRAHIVNLAQVVRFRGEGKGRLVAVMSDGSRVAVSRTNAQALRDASV